MATTNEYNDRGLGSTPGSGASDKLNPGEFIEIVRETSSNKKKNKSSYKDAPKGGWKKKQPQVSDQLLTELTKIAAAEPQVKSEELKIDDEGNIHLPSEPTPVQTSDKRPNTKKDQKGGKNKKADSDRTRAVNAAQLVQASINDGVQQQKAAKDAEFTARNDELERRVELKMQEAAVRQIEEEAKKYKLPAACCVAVNVQNYDRAINVRDKAMFKDNGLIACQGVQTKFDGKDYIVNGHVTYLSEYDQVVAVSKDDLFAVVKEKYDDGTDRQPGLEWLEKPKFVEHGGVIYRLEGGPIENMRYCVYASLRKYPTTKNVLDKERVIEAAARIFRRDYGNMVDPTSVADKIFLEPWVLPTINTYFSGLMSNRRQRFEVLAKAIESNLYPVLGTINVISPYESWILFTTLIAAISTYVHGARLLFVLTCGLVVAQLIAYKLQQYSYPAKYTLFMCITYIALVNRSFSPSSLFNFWLVDDYFAILLGVTVALQLRWLRPPVGSARERLSSGMPMYEYNWNGPPTDYLSQYFEEVGTISSKRFMQPCAAAYLPKHTVSNRTYPDIDDGVESLLVPDNTEVKQNDRVGIIGVHIEGVQSVLPANNDINLEAALRIRMGFRRTIEAKRMARFKQHFKEFIALLPPIVLDPMSLDDFIKQQYPGKRGDMIRDADDELTDDCIWSDLFVKLETYLGKCVDSMKPRMIWSRHPTLIKVFGRYFYSLGKQLAAHFGVDSRLFYASGHNATAVGAYAMRMDSNKYIYEMDVSNWDGSMNADMLECELMLMEQIKGWPVEIDWLLENWTKVWGRTRTGIRYKAKYGRRSGDLWTSLFNSILNMAITTFVVKELTSDMHDNSIERLNLYLMVLGDDGVLSLNKRINVNDVVAIYADLGLKVEVIERERMSDAGFCSGRFWKVAGKLHWGNMPFRQWAKFGLNYHNHPPKRRKGLLLGMAKSLLPNCGHIPIFGAFLRAIVRTGEASGVRAYYDNADKNPFRIMGGEAFYSMGDTVEQFCEIYGFEPYMIDLYEDMIEREVHIDMFPCTITDEKILEGFLVDCPNDNEPAQPQIELTDDYIVNVAPVKEEHWKQAEAKEIGIIAACDRLSSLEIEMGAPRYVKHLHRLFGVVSCVSLEAGITLHRLWNWMSVVMKKYECASCCAKKMPRKGKKGKKQQNNSTDWKKVAGALLKQTGKAVGSYMGGPIGGMVGEAAGSYFSKLTGMGAYKVAQNTLMTNNQAPRFGSGNGTTRIRHSEFVGLVYSSQEFNVTRYALNPGLPDTFPWLANIAKAYETYSFDGFVWSYKPLSAFAVASTNTALGVVVMSTQYDASLDNFGSRREMEAYMFTTSTAPQEFMVHPVECRRKFNPLDEYFLRYDESVGISSDLRWSDLGFTNIATEGQQVDGVVLGELWVSYDIVFEKPRLYSGPVTLNATWAVFNLSEPDISSSYPLGTGVTVNPTAYGDTGNDIKLLPSARVMLFQTGVNAGYYLVNLWWRGTFAETSPPTITPTDCEIVFWFQDQSQQYQETPNSGVESQYSSLSFVVLIGAAEANLTFGTDGDFPTTADLMVSVSPVGSYPLGYKAFRSHKFVEVKEEQPRARKFW